MRLPRFLSADAHYNLAMTRKNVEAITVEDQKRLDSVSLMHVGDMINCFRSGSLVMRLPEHELSGQSSVLFGTVGGMIGMVLTLPHNKYMALSRIQHNLTHVVRGVGNFRHKE